MRIVPALITLAACGAPPAEPPTLCPAPSGDAVDAIDVARLDADATEPVLIHWVKEGDDAIATVRDDDPTTGWTPDATRTSTLSIDLGPYAGRPVALDRLTLDFNPAALPTGIEVRRLDACGGEVLSRQKVDPAEHVTVDVSGCGACVEVAVDGIADTRLLDVSLTARDPAVAPPAPPEPIARGDQHPTMGVVEGFYGHPWTSLERSRMVDMLGAHGLGTYIYAPKEDPLHRAEWRSPYDAAFIDRFAALAADGAARNVDVLFGVSPFLDLDPNDPTDLDALTTKLGTFVDRGIPGIAIFADDIEFVGPLSVDGALGAEQAVVVNAVFDRLRVGHPDLIVWFVGTVYSDARLDSFPDGEAYLEALSTLDPAVHVMWTGTDTFAPTLSPDDLVRASDLVGRPLALWDNSWANDGGDGFLGRILLGPWSGRTADLPDALTGTLMNPSMQGGLSRLNVGTFASWIERADNGLAGEDERAQRLDAATAELRYTAGVAANADLDTLLMIRVMESFDANSAQTPIDRDLATQANAVADDLQTSTLPYLQSVTALAQRATALAALRTQVHHSGLAPELVDELDFPLRKVSAEADLVLAALELVARRSGGEPDGDAATTLQAAADNLTASARFQVDQTALERLADTALAYAPIGALPLPTATGTLPTTCRVGEPLRLEPFTGAETLQVAGLPGADVVGTVARWTPGWPGTYEAVILGTGTLPRVVRFTLVCRP